ncbi:hypothetical protein [Salinivibrio sp. VYel1]|uniref:hypothetical protein n=2 Tax=unclassified Salinivibrio TaxID=2636825 RepID=UPI00128BDD5C|nr:hypothetical protein [Salinivibrio sp. VYel1]MPX90430.1 hypothetical protein [Salinivibrio sp. VYel1]
MESETLDWLSEKAPAFGELPEREKMAIMDFALLWSFFESRCLGNKANIPQIRDYAQQLPHTTVNSYEIDQISSYFRARYTENGEYSYRYHHLRLERSGNPQEVTAMLLGGADHREALIGCLAILYRYRNNLFHGEKWEHEIQGQQENFERATSLLRWLMDQHT